MKEATVAVIETVVQMHQLSKNKKIRLANLNRSFNKITHIAGKIKGELEEEEVDVEEEEEEQKVEV